MKTELTVARVLKPRGLKGEVKIETYLSNPSQISHIKKVKIDKQEYTVEHISLDGVFGYIKFLEINDADAADALRGKEITASKSDLPSLAEGEYYIADMIGLSVIVSGERIGEVVDVAQYGSADVYTVKSAQGTFCFPAIKGLIKQVDFQNGVIVLDGMLFDRVVVYN